MISSTFIRTVVALGALIGTSGAVAPNNAPNNAAAPQAAAAPASPAAPADPNVSGAATKGYAYLGCFCTTQEAAQAFSSSVANTAFGNGVALNTKCAAYCRAQKTQYYSNIDYEGQCACGNALSTTLNYTLTTAGCQPCGDGKLDENYAKGAGICGDYYYGCAAVYSLDF